MYRYIKNLMLAGVLALAVGACDSLIETEPRQSVSSEIALTSLSGVQAVLTEAYDKLQDVDHYGQYYVLYPDALADNIQQTPTNSNRYTFVSRNDDRAHLNRWSASYEAINLVNNILVAIDDLDVDQATRDQIKGESYFLRALNYFDLVRTKAYEPGREVGGWTEGVILRTEPTRTPDDADYRTRSSVAETYTLIKSDLEQAIQLLEPPTATTDKHRANEAAAHALLARVHLYAGEWEAAEQQATLALETTNATILPADEYVSEFQDATNRESLFEIRFDENRDGDATFLNESLSSMTMPASYDGLNRWGDLIPTEDLLNAYEEGDVRRDLYVPLTKGGSTFTYITKWNSSVGTYTDNVPVLRYSEVLLIRAEARAEQDNVAGALEDLNELRANRGLDALAGLSQPQAIEAILQERRVEFAFEGHRFFDLKRRGLDIPKPQTGSGNPIPYEDYRILAPIPTAETDQNPDLEQNPGY